MAEDKAKGHPTEKMALWNQLCQTNPKYTKKVEIGKRKFTAIDPYYQFRKLTEVLGPFGIDWGVDESHFKVIADGKLILFHARMWYNLDGVRGEFPIQSAARIFQGEDRVDDDCIKKVVTDALTKGGSMLGLSADVFLGFFDNHKYVSELQKANSQNPENNRPGIGSGKPSPTAQHPTTEGAPPASPWTPGNGSEEDPFVQSVRQVARFIGNDTLRQALDTYGVEQVEDIQSEERKSFFGDLAKFGIRTQKITAEKVKEIIAEAMSQQPVEGVGSAKLQ